MKHIGLFIISIALLLASFVQPSLAQDANSGMQNENQEVRTVQSSQIEGEVVRKDNNALIIQTNEGVRSLAVPSNVSINRNTMQSSLGEIQPGDKVTISQSNTGEILSIDATASQVFDFGKYAVPLLLAGLIAGFIIWTLMRKAQQSHIRTTVG